MNTFVNFLFMIVAAFCLFLVKGLVILFGWDWFIEPFGVPMITLGHAIGLGLFISFLTNMDFKEDKENSYDITEPTFINDFGSRVYQVIFQHAFILLILYIVSFFTPPVL